MRDGQRTRHPHRVHRDTGSGVIQLLLWCTDTTETADSSTIPCRTILTPGPGPGSAVRTAHSQTHTQQPARQATARHARWAEYLSEMPRRDFENPRLYRFEMYIQADCLIAITAFNR